MSGFLGLYGEAQPAFSGQGSIYDYDATAADAYFAGLERAMDTNPFPMILRTAQSFSEDLKSIAGEIDRISQKDAQEEAKRFGVEIEVPVGGMTRWQLDTTIFLKQREQYQNNIAVRSRSFSSGASAFVGSLAGSFVDPVNVASAFIPVVPQARYLKWLDEAKGAFGRTTIRAGVGAAEGALGAALVEPLILAGASEFQLDYGLMDSFLNVTVGTVLGSGLHAGLGGVGDAFAPNLKSRLRDGAPLLPEHVRREMLHEGVKAAEEGRLNRAEDIAKRYLKDEYGITDDAFLGKRIEDTPSFVEKARSTVVEARADAPTPKTQPPPPDSIRLYRGEGGRGEAASDKGGGWFTTDRAKAERFAGEDGEVVYIDIRKDDAATLQKFAQGHGGKDEFVTDDLGFVAKNVVKEGGGAKAQKAAQAELKEAGVKEADTLDQATAKVAELRANKLRERARNDPEFKADELYRRGPGDESPEGLQSQGRAADAAAREGAAAREPLDQADDSPDATARVDEELEAGATRDTDPAAVASEEEAFYMDAIKDHEAQGRVKGEVAEAVNEILEEGRLAAERQKAIADLFEAAEGCMRSA